MILPISQRREHLGFTLIELMIAVAIVAVLAAIALPSYLEQARKARRADVQTVLNENAQALERNYTRVGCYHKTTAADCIANTGTNYAIALTKSPMEGSETYYQIALTTINTNAYTLTATPVNAQTGDQCGNLTLTNTGTKGCSLIADNNDCIDTCWRR